MEIARPGTLGAFASALIACLAALSAVPATAGGEPLAVTTATGHRLVGESAEAAPGFVGLRIGGCVYELERRGSTVEGEGEAAADPAWRELVEALAAGLGGEDETLARAARAGLLALGPRAAPYLRRAARSARPGRRAAIEEVAEALEAAPAGGEGR